MPDTITAILSVVSSLLLAFAMADDAGYAKANGFFDALYYGLGSLAKPIGVTTDVVSGVSAGISSTASLTKYIIPIAAVILAYMAFTAYAPRRK